MPRSFDAISEQMAAIQTALDSTDSRLQDIHVKVVGIESKVEIIHADMRGNNRPLPVRMELVEHRIAEIEERARQQKAVDVTRGIEDRRYKITVIGIGVTAIVAIVAQIVNWLLRALAL